MKVFDRVARRIERSGGAGYGADALLEDNRQKTVASAVVLANSLAHAKLVVFTRHGAMARYVSNMRPEKAPIFAFTLSEQVFGSSPSAGERIRSARFSAFIGSVTYCCLFTLAISRLTPLILFL